jgi:hypothetical protein
MAIINPSNVNEIEFDEQDIEVFKIPDVKERIAALQDHFFPRLELLVKDSIELIKEIYGVDPYETMTDVYTPSNRTNAVTNKLHGLVHVGLSGKRRNSKKDQPLAIKNASGKQIYIHSAYLTFDVLSQGCIRVVFQPFSTSVEPSFVSKVRQEIQSNIEMINTLFTDFEIYYNSNITENSNDFYTLINTKRFGLPDEKDIHSLYFCTGAYFFPTNFEDELSNLKLAFVCLYPLLDLFISIGDDREPRFAEMINKFNEWYNENNIEESDKQGEKSTLRTAFNEEAITVLRKERGDKYVDWLDTVSTDEFIRWLDNATPEEMATSMNPLLGNDLEKWFLKNPATTPNGISLAKTEDKLIDLPLESLEEITIDRENIESKLDFNPENLTDARERTNRAIVQRQGQSKFRSELLKAYGGQCAITDCDAEAALEAAHIFPYLGTDTNHVKNGLLLCADIHTLFDLYLISINPDTSKVVVSSILLNTCYKELNGKSLKSPKDYAASPSQQALARHYETFLLKQNK